MGNIVDVLQEIGEHKEEALTQARDLVEMLSAECNPEAEDVVEAWQRLGTALAALGYDVQPCV